MSRFGKQNFRKSIQLTGNKIKFLTFGKLNSDKGAELSPLNMNWVKTLQKNVEIMLKVDFPKH